MTQVTLQKVYYSFVYVSLCGEERTRQKTPYLHFSYCLPSNKQEMIRDRRKTSEFDATTTLVRNSNCESFALFSSAWHPLSRVIFGASIDLECEQLLKTTSKFQSMGIVSRYSKFGALGFDSDHAPRAHGIVRCRVVKAIRFDPLTPSDID